MFQWVLYPACEGWSVMSEVRTSEGKPSGGGARDGQRGMITSPFENVQRYGIDVAEDSLKRHYAMERKDQYGTLVQLGAYQSLMEIAWDMARAINALERFSDTDNHGEPYPSHVLDDLSGLTELGRRLENAKAIAARFFDTEEPNAPTGTAPSGASRASTKEANNV